MRLDNHRGAVSTMMIFNLLLVVVIITAIYLLVTRLQEPEIPTPANISPSTPSASAPRQQASTTARTTQAAPEEIAALKKQLEEEATRLKALKEEEENIKAINSGGQTPAKTDQNENTTSSLITPMGFPERPPSN